MCMMCFSEDTDFIRLTPTRIVLYSVSFFYVGEPNCMACSILSLTEALSCRPTKAPVWQEASSMLRIHQPMLFESIFG